LIVATKTYADEGLRELRSAAADAAALTQVLTDSQIGDFDVSTVLDRPAHEVAEAVEDFFADRKPEDLLLIHLSGHGIKNQDGELHFAMTNTKLDRLAATSVSAQFLNRLMSASRARSIVLFLDCCYAGAFGRGMVTRGSDTVDLKERFSGQGRAVITATGALEYAFEGGQLADGQPDPSVFTAAMVRGLATGEADRNRDGWVGLDELYEYVFDAVRDVNPHQTPSMWAFGVQGNLHLARRSGALPVTDGGDEHVATTSTPSRYAATPSAAAPASSSWSRRWVTRAVALAVIVLLAAAVGWWQLAEPEFDGVPETFDGTWVGDAPVYGGTATLTLHLTRGATQTRVQSEGDGGRECLLGDLTLTGGDDSELEGSFEPDNAACAAGTASLTLEDDQVRYHLVVDKATGSGSSTSATLTRQ
jgi:hypothetical protein